MDGQKLREARGELGWTRQKLIARANEIAERDGIKRVTLSHLAVVEQGKRPASEEESILFKRVLLEALGRVMDSEVPDGEPEAAVTVQGDGATRSYEWNGFRRGDACKVVGERGVFTFQYHHMDDHQEYVEVSGPRQMVQGRAIGWKQRSFATDRIVPTRKRKK